MNVVSISCRVISQVSVTVKLLYQTCIICDPSKEDTVESLQTNGFMSLNSSAQDPMTIDCFRWQITGRTYHGKDIVYVGIECLCVARRISIRPQHTNMDVYIASSYSLCQQLFLHSCWCHIRHTVFSCYVVSFLRPPDVRNGELGPFGSTWYSYSCEAIAACLSQDKKACVFIRFSEAGAVISWRDRSWDVDL